MLSRDDSKHAAGRLGQRLDERFTCSWILIEFGQVWISPPSSGRLSTKLMCSWP
jgi:hypothetical protein